MIKAGILGGGQLGRMMLQEAANYPVETFVMENDPECPSAHLCHHFTRGDIRNFDDVYEFGKNLDVITIEIEQVNTEALEKLKSEGVRVIPDPGVLRIIQNKIRQKEFYRDNEIPSSPFIVTAGRGDISVHPGMFPAMHKLAEGGYDGRGVKMLRTEEDAKLGFDEPAVLEKAIAIKKEISVIAGVFTNGDIVTFPAVEMVFDPELNLVSYQISPAGLSEPLQESARMLAVKLVRNFNSPGIFAVECFVDENDEILVNETAPRVHNSGHHTIEACYSSQFDMLWRIMLRLPAGNTDIIMPAAMVNIIGEKDARGAIEYEGLDRVLEKNNTFVHIYGKKNVSPGRKMGHITILSQNRESLLKEIEEVKNCIVAGAKKI